MLYTAIRQDGPVAILYPKCECLSMPVGQEYRVLPIGKGEIVAPGQGVAIIAVGAMLQNALSAAFRLKKYGIHCTVMNARYIKPLDEEMILNLTSQHQNIIIVEENISAGGYGSLALEFITARRIKGVTIKLLGIPDKFITHGPRELLLQQCGLDVDGICRAVRELKLPAVGIRARV